MRTATAYLQKILHFGVNNMDFIALKSNLKLRVLTYTDQAGSGM